MILVNGSKGIGTGYSTTVPQFNPRDLIHAIRLRIYGKSTKEERYGDSQLKPWFRDWDGSTELKFLDVGKKRLDKWVFKGKFEVDDDEKTPVL